MTWEIDWYQNEWPWSLFRGRLRSCEPLRNIRHSIFRKPLRPKLLLMTNISRICVFDRRQDRWPWSAISWNSLGISVEFRIISWIWEPTAAKRMKIGPCCQLWNNCSPLNVVFQQCINWVDVAVRFSARATTRVGWKPVIFELKITVSRKRYRRYILVSMRFRLTPRSITLKFERPAVRIVREFRRFGW